MRVPLCSCGKVPLRDPSGLDRRIKETRDWPPVLQPLIGVLVRNHWGPCCRRDTAVQNTLRVTSRNTQRHHRRPELPKPPDLQYRSPQTSPSRILMFSASNFACIGGSALRFGAPARKSVNPRPEDASSSHLCRNLSHSSILHQFVLHTS